MSFKKFKPDDIILNTLRAHPQCEFFIYDGDVFYNNVPNQSGSRNTQVRNVGPGNISLYEYNIDRPYINTDRVIGDSGSYTKRVSELEGDPITFLLDTDQIYPWISKDSAGASFKTVGKTSYGNEFQYGDILTGSYPLTASIVREYIEAQGAAPTNKHFLSLQNRLNFYGIRSEHYLVNSSHGNKKSQNLNLISIPSIFFGAQIKPGTISLRWYYTGSLVAELQDIKQNGELIQVGPTGSAGTGSVNGVVLYDEGFLLLTGAFDLNGETTSLDGASNNPKWIYFGAGTNDGTTPSPNASFGLSFKGTTETQVMTLFTHASRGQANYSNNPTFFKYGQNHLQFTSSNAYEENPDKLLANTVSSSYTDYSASFQRQVYVSKVGVYDENKNLIGVATLANPVLKKEDEDITIKLKLDI